MTHRRIVTALVLFWIGLAIGAAAVKPEPGVDMTTRAKAFLDSLRPAQKKAAMMSYDDKRRVDWHFIPKDERKGLEMNDMNSTQRRATFDLLNAALSETGVKKTRAIMEMEQILNDAEVARGSGRWVRDAERYYVTVFGQPSTRGTWGLSFEGHHLSLNFVVTAGRVASHSPFMFGANPTKLPRAVPHYKGGEQVLGVEEQSAFDLLHALSADQRKVAVIAAKAPREMRSAGDAQPPSDGPAGIAASKLNDKQKAGLKAIINEYLRSMPDAVAKRRWAEIDQAGFDKVHFAWAGADKPGIGHYYRIQGPTFLVEFVNTQPDSLGNPASHIHCMWRDLRGDFGIKR